MKTLKYNYNKVIQQNYGQGWEDVSEYETDSAYMPKEWLDRPKIDGVTKCKLSLCRHDFNEYMLTGYATRIIQRKTLNPDYKHN